MVAHILFPRVDGRPASLSGRWIAGTLRGELGFSGAVFADDLSMAGAASFGDIVARATQALAAGGGLWPGCNSPTSAQQFLDGLDIVPRPAAHLPQGLLRVPSPSDPATLLRPRHRL